MSDKTWISGVAAPIGVKQKAPGHLTYDYKDAPLKVFKTNVKGAVSIEPCLKPYARLHGTLSVSLCLTTLVSIIILVFALIIRNFTLDFVKFFIGESMDTIVQDMTEARNASWEDMEYPPVLKDDTIFRTDRHVYIGRWSRLYSDLAIANVILIWSTNIAGLICFSHKANAMVASFVGMNLVTMLFMIFTAHSLIFSSESVNHGLSHDLITIIRIHYRFIEGNVVSRLFNSIMIVGNCCGIHGPEDFGVRTFQSDTTTFDLEVPMACCKTQFWHLYDDDILLTCMKAGVSEENAQINRHGCFEAYSDMFRRFTSPYILALCLLVIIEQIIQILVGIVIIRWTTFVDHQTFVERGVLISNNPSGVDREPLYSRIPMPPPKMEPPGYDKDSASEDEDEEDETEEKKAAA